jgi:hypothetical protein
MAKKKKNAQADAATNGSASPAPNGSAPKEKKPAAEPSTSALIICRNK